MAVIAPPPDSVATNPTIEPRTQEQKRQPLGERVFNVFVWLLFTLLWAGFVVVLLSSQSTLGDLWHATRDLPLVLQGVIWLLFLPLMAGLWVWHTTWPLLARLVLTASLALANVYIFFPRRPQQ
jgi:hypothetical protein